MSGVRAITRRPHITEYNAVAASAPIYVNDTDNSLRIVPAGTGSSEAQVMLGVPGVTGAFRIAAGTGTLASGTLVVATGLSTVLSFQADIKEPATGTFTTGANEVVAIIVKSITTGAVTVDGVFNAFATGAATVSVSGTATFYWLALGT